MLVAMKRAAVFSRGIFCIPNIVHFFPNIRLDRPSRREDCVLGWGLRPSTRKARAYALKHRLPFIALEDGFLRSLGLGVAGYPPFSLVVDDVGIYYDTTRASRLEALILAAEMPVACLDEAQAAMALILAHGLSKYNHAPDYVPQVEDQAGLPENRVLVIDQTFGDMALQYGGADETTFARMFAAAVAENPQAQIWVKTHPDVLSGKKRGYLTDLAQTHGQIRLLAEDINPVSLLRQVDKVYCVTSQMGFEALLCGKPVTVFGLPWYAGWGLTDDRHEGVAALQAAGRRAPRSLVQLFAAAYLQYSRYLNPNTGQPGTIFDVIHYLAGARRANEQLRGDLYCVGVSLWKRAVMRPFFRLPSCRLHFVGSIAKLEQQTLPEQARLLVWGRGKAALLDYAARRKLPVLRMEDGFIRSVGLGSNLVPPLSLVVDDMGIYFDPGQVSRLEYILQHTVFDEHDRRAAGHVRQALTENAISKYNVGSAPLQTPPPGKTVLLVPGQVEDDASIRHGSPQICRNLDLLKTVRARHPEAYIIYKPHPDVVSGNRIGHIPEQECLRYADQIAAEADILTCLAQSDAVHTMTSLTGFEALLRGKEVYCYGLPFYAGWGLTHDALSLPRRSRRLALWELVAGTLLHYPTYIHPHTRQRMDAATAVAVLHRQKQQQGGGGLHRGWLAKQAGKLRQLYVSLRG